MPHLFSTSRAEAAVFRYPPVFFPVAIATALVLQAYLPVLVHVALYLDLPLLVVIYWAINVRNPMSSSLLGAIMGLAEDSLSHLALGINGIAKTVIGYLNASLGTQVDADHAGMRLGLVVVGFELNRLIVYLFERFLLGTPVPWRGAAYLLAALCNGALAAGLYRGFDRFRYWV
ncbi:MAG: rod shape-determining protein MreD [Streptosporangiaceae bacterium]